MYILGVFKFQMQLIAWEAANSNKLKYPIMIALNMNAVHPA